MKLHVIGEVAERLNAAVSKTVPTLTLVSFPPTYNRLSDNEIALIRSGFLALWDSEHHITGQSNTSRF